MDDKSKHLDVTKPGLPPAKATSRSVLINNQQLKNDPMMRDNAPNQDVDNKELSDKPDELTDRERVEKANFENSRVNLSPLTGVDESSKEPNFMTDTKEIDTQNNKDSSNNQDSVESNHNIDQDEATSDHTEMPGEVLEKEKSKLDQRSEQVDDLIIKKTYKLHIDSTPARKIMYIFGGMFVLVAALLVFALLMYFYKK